MEKQTKWLLAGMMMLAMSANVKAQTFEVDLSKQNPKSYAVEVPDGNYKVTVVLGSKKRQPRRWCVLKPEDSWWMKSLPRRVNSRPSSLSSTSVHLRFLIR